MGHGSGAGRFSAILVLGRIRNWDYARGHGNDDLNVLTPDLAHSGKGARHGPLDRRASSNRLQSTSRKCPAAPQNSGRVFSRGDVIGPRARENRPNGGETVASVVAET